MNEENRLLVTDEPVEVHDLIIITVLFRGICGLYLELFKENQNITTRDQLDLETLGF
jgi:hypothetical protein